MKWRIVVLSLVAFTTVGAQEPTKWRWSISGGPALITGHSYFIPSSKYQNTLSAEDTLVSGASAGRFNVTLSLSKRVPASALMFRSELSYFEGGSRPRAFQTDTTWCTPNCIPAAPLFAFRESLREQTMALAIGTEWLAFPRWRWSPYLLTTVGAYRTRMAWSKDAGSARADRTERFYGAITTMGVGSRVPLGRHDLFAELRRQRLWINEGSDFMSLSIGLRY